MNKRNVEIEFRIDKNGKRRAYRWDMRQQRYFPMGLALADAMIASGEATEYIATRGGTFTCDETVTPQVQAMIARRLTEIAPAESAEWTAAARALIAENEAVLAENVVILGRVSTTPAPRFSRFADPRKSAQQEMDELFPS
ncbi:MAG: hypothetical protein WCG26_01110 [Chloroflexales bacterium]